MKNKDIPGIEKLKKRQEEFDRLPSNHKEMIISRLKEEADDMSLLIQTGQVKNYNEALEMLEELKDRPKSFKIEIGEEGEFWVTFEDNGIKELIGNVFDDAVIKDKNGEIMEYDMDKMEENIEKLTIMVDQLLKARRLDPEN